MLLSGTFVLVVGSRIPGAVSAPCSPVVRVHGRLECGDLWTYPSPSSGSCRGSSCGGSGDGALGRGVSPGGNVLRFRQQLVAVGDRVLWKAVGG